MQGKASADCHVTKFSMGNGCVCSAANLLGHAQLELFPVGHHNTDGRVLILPKVSAQQNRFNPHNVLYYINLNWIFKELVNFKTYTFNWNYLLKICQVANIYIFFNHSQKRKCNDDICVHSFFWMLLYFCTHVMFAFEHTHRYMIESPRWLASVGKLDECAKYLTCIARINGKTDVDVSEIYLKKMLPDNNKVENVYGMLSFFTGWRIAMNTMLLVMCWYV